MSGSRAKNPVPLPGDFYREWHILSVGCDYLTFTARVDEDAQGLARDGRDLMAMLRGNGAMVRNWLWQGYAGESSEGLSWGWRRDSAIIRMSSDVAREHAHRLHERPGRARRLDLQVTAVTDEPITDVAYVYYATAAERRDSAGRNLRHTLVTNNAGGQTLYIGSPASQRMLRCYRKDVESAGEWPAGTWRFEVQLRDIAASGTYVAYGDMLSDRHFVHDVVYGHYDTAGAPLPWPQDHDVPAVELHRRRWDHERCLRWLMDSVAPAVERLTEYYDLLTICRALGLTKLDLTRMLGPRLVPSEPVDRG